MTIPAKFYFPVTPVVNLARFLNIEWQQFLQNPQFTTLTNTPITGFGYFYPPKPDGTSQTAAGITAGTGAPSNADGSNGWFYFRSDGGAGTYVYFKTGGAWVGIL